ncbi:response regulator [Mariprofundus sp. EBB-1]|uniref:response regulator n=1 Tax=Mariprofundus sp. EBB-1 TaxID=2650971 RepID=UPI000EF1942C|nr:response regulator [Mariprofundus sp. EBB-1]RLL51715.1 response regulator [Mariprofundus sp. EBB-1]
MSKTVLIIEDNDDNMELISFIMKKNGYLVLKAMRGEQGVAMAIEHRPDFIILDIQLPDIDGLEVARRIRASEANGRIPIIAMTSFAMLGDRELLLTAGCNAYIEKPIDVSLVIQQIREAIGESV